MLLKYVLGCRSIAQLVTLMISKRWFFYLNKLLHWLEVFLDKRPFRSTENSRLEVLLTVGKYVKDWQQTSDTSHAKNFITQECYLDLISAVTGFHQLARMKLASHPLAYICVAHGNTDVVENFFSSHQAVNGCTNNPTTLQHSESVNTILISRTLVSTKSNAGGNMVVGGAKPFKLHVAPPRSGCMLNIIYISPVLINTHKNVFFNGIGQHLFSFFVYTDIVPCTSTWNTTD